PAALLVSSLCTISCATARAPGAGVPRARLALAPTAYEVAREADAPIAAGEAAFRWRSSGALRLYVQPTSALAGWTPRHLALVDEAVLAWTAAGSAHIERVAWPHEADIRLYWTDQLPTSNPGITMLYRTRGGRLARADVFVRVEPAPWGTGSPDRVLYCTIAHELGHALGLGHDPAPGSLMHAAPLVTAVTRLDVARLERLLKDE